MQKMFAVIWNFDAQLTLMTSSFYFRTRLQRQVCLSQGFLKIQDMLYNVVPRK